MQCILPHVRTMEPPKRKKKRSEKKEEGKKLLEKLAENALNYISVEKSLSTLAFTC
jgi:hypothetical protein